MKAGQDWEAGVEVLVGAEVGTGQPSVSIEYASQARLRLKNYAAHKHTHTERGQLPPPPPLTHTRKQVNSIWLVYPAHKLIQWSAPNALSLAH